MENNNNIEVIFFSKYALKDSRRKELAKWLTTTIQTAIRKQHQRTKKMYLEILKDTPAIFMS